MWYLPLLKKCNNSLTTRTVATMEHESSSEQSNQLRHSIKKHKRNEDMSAESPQVDEEMEYVHEWSVHHLQRLSKVNHAENDLHQGG